MVRQLSISNRDNSKYQIATTTSTREDTTPYCTALIMSKIADFYDEEVDAAVSNLLSLMEPVMIVFLGIVVGGMVVAMYLPIFDMINAVQ